MNSPGIIDPAFIKEEVILPVDCVEDPENDIQATSETPYLSAVKEELMEHDENSNAKAASFYSCRIKQELDETETEATPAGLYYEVWIPKDEPNDFEGSSTQDNSNDCLNDLNIHSESPEVTEKVDEGKYFACFDCDIAFNSVNLLKKHLPNHFSTKKRVICMECGNIYKNIYDLVFHMDAHSNKFKQISAKIPSDVELNLNANIQPSEDIIVLNHSKPINKKYNDKCFRCNDFNDLNYLKRHTVNCKVPFTCPKCPNEFQCGCNLLRHMKLHKMRRPFQCDKCNSEFRNLILLKKHLKSHVEKDFYKCKICYEEFKYMDSLIYHCAYTHYSKSFVCIYCEKLFSTDTALIRHMKIVHELHSRKKEEHKKNLKKLKICTRYSLNFNSVEKKKDFKCDICDKDFAAIEDLEKHKISHVKRPVKTYSRKEQ